MTTCSPSPSVYRELTGRGFANVRAWSHGVNPDVFRPRGKADLDLPRPIHVFIRRLAIEKNLPTFLELELPGSKVVDRDQLMRDFPDAHFCIATGDDKFLDVLAPSGDSPGRARDLPAQP